MALSADGNTALIGGPGDNSDVGAAWVFTGSGSSWTQQAKLTDSTADSGAASSATAWRCRADGNTALIGGPVDNSVVGAAWVFAGSDTSAPSISIRSPGENAAYTSGEVVHASYSCTDLDGPADIASCSGPVASGSAIPTSPGKHSFTVNAQDMAGNHSALTHDYIVYAPDGSGQMTVSPTSVVHSTAHHTLTFTYTAAKGGIFRGTLTLTAPAGWSAPSTSPAAPGSLKTSEGRASVSGRTITVPIPILASFHTLTITYGSRAAGGPGATAPAAAGTNTWPAQERSIPHDTLTNLATPPRTKVT